MNFLLKVSMEQEYDYLFKIVLVGFENSGKSTFISNELIGGPYNPTIGGCFVNQVIELNGKLIKLNIWDTAGQDRFRSLLKMYLREANAFMLFFDVTSKDSFLKAGEILQLIRSSNPALTNSFLIGNIIDLEEIRVVFRKEAEEFAEANGMTFIEASAVFNTTSNILNMVSKQILSNHTDC